MGPDRGLSINLAKCELFSPTIKSSFPPVAKKLLSVLLEMADSDLHVAISLLRICGGFCKLVHVSRTTPPSLSSEALRAFDGETRSCFSACLAADVTDAAWQQAQLSLSFGGLGLRSLALHSSSAFLASFSALGVGNTNNLYLQQCLIIFNSQVSHTDAVTIESVLADQPRQRSLSQKLDGHLFETLLMSSSPANKARLLSASAPHASAWLSVAPSVGLNLHLHSPEFQTAVRWWLGLDTSFASVCPFFPGVALNSLSHHAMSCRHGGDTVIRHNKLRDIADLCRKAHLSVRVEAGHSMYRDNNHSRLADVLVEGWERSQPAALDITVTSPLTPVSLKESSRFAGVAALSAETRKHAVNDPKCRELGWMCIPMAVETYGNWGKEVQHMFSQLAVPILLSTFPAPSPEFWLTYNGRLNICLVRAVARAILGRGLSPIHL
ncbi:hypothetical protein EMCRGX_G034950 [Ephydatia muelleri]